MPVCSEKFCVAVVEKNGDACPVHRSRPGFKIVEDHEIKDDTKPCPRCEGSGDCNFCEGCGECTCDQCDNEHECGKCNGTGRCEFCDGEGRIAAPQTHDDRMVQEMNSDTRDLDRKPTETSDPWEQELSERESKNLLTFFEK